MSGTSTKFNKLTGICSFMSVTADDIKQQISAKFPKGVAIFKEDTHELLIADHDNCPLTELKDHAHPYTHAPLIHSHMYGTNQAWFISEPRLWYRNDLDNHPELIPLDGQELTDDQSVYLAEMYPGTKLATEPVSYVNGKYSNDYCTMTVSSDEGTSASTLFGDMVTVDNFYRTSDQWLTNNTSLTTEQSITVTYKNDITYRPSEYWICPANPSNYTTMRPVPKKWVFEGSNDGSTYTVLDSHDEANNEWGNFTFRKFTVTTDVKYKYLRLRILSWHAGDGSSTGLRRFYIYGRKNGIFSMPKVESLNPDFAWVVPIRNQDVGLKHEEVGDLGITSLLPANMPSYRIPADGRLLNRNEDTELYAAIGHTQDTEITSFGQITASDGGTINSDSSWTSNAATATTSTYVQYNLLSPAAIGSYIIDSTGHRLPKSWTISVKNGDTWSVIQTMTDVSPDDITSVKGHFYIDTIVEDIAAQSIKLTVTAWDESTSDPFGIKLLRIFSHPVNQFYIPNIMYSDDPTELPITYIVRRNTATDVTSRIISDLQQNITTLTNVISTLQNRVDKLDANIKTS